MSKIRLHIGRTTSKRLISPRERGAKMVNGAFVEQTGAQIRAGDHIVVKRPDGIREIVPVTKVERVEE